MEGKQKTFGTYFRRPAARDSERFVVFASSSVALFLFAGVLSSSSESSSSASLSLSNGLSLDDGEKSEDKSSQQNHARTMR